MFHCENVVWLNNLEGVPSLYCLACDAHSFVNENRNCKYSSNYYCCHICLTHCCARSSIDENIICVIFPIITDSQAMGIMCNVVVMLVINCLWSTDAYYINFTHHYSDNQSCESEPCHTTFTLYVHMIAHNFNYSYLKNFSHQLMFLLLQSLLINKYFIILVESWNQCYLNVHAKASAQKTKFKDTMTF